MRSTFQRFAHWLHRHVDRLGERSSPCLCFFALLGSTWLGLVHKEKPRRSGGALKPLSGDHGSAVPALAQTFNVPGKVMSDAASEQSGNDQFIFEKNFHDTTADLKPDIPPLLPRSSTFWTSRTIRMRWAHSTRTTRWPHKM
jgi:hypothetical protein